MYTVLYLMVSFNLDLFSMILEITSVEWNSAITTPGLSLRLCLRSADTTDISGKFRPSLTNVLTFWTTFSIGCAGKFLITKRNDVAVWAFDGLGVLFTLVSMTDTRSFSVLICALRLSFTSLISTIILSRNFVIKRSSSWPILSFMDCSRLIINFANSPIVGSPPFDFLALLSSPSHESDRLRPVLLPLALALTTVGVTLDDITASTNSASSLLEVDGI